MSYTTAQVNVFPSAYRTEKPSGKFTSEQNITNLIKSLANKDSFVVDYVTVGKILKVVIDGYYFEIKDYDLPTGDLTLYIYVKDNYLLSVSGTTSLDASGNFVGISDSDPGIPADYLRKLEVLKAGKLVNKGYISELIDGDGNWIDLSNILTNIFNFPSTQYIKNLIAQYATTLANSEDVLVNAGGESQPIYFKDGLPKAIIKNIGTDGTSGGGTANTFKPVYLSSGEIKAVSQTVGSDTKDALIPVYANSGTITKLSKDSGTSSRPVFVDDGAIKPITQNAGLSTTIQTTEEKRISRNIVKINGGVIGDGNIVHISNIAPGNISGTEGDLWFVIGA